MDAPQSRVDRHDNTLRLISRLHLILTILSMIPMRPDIRELIDQLPHRDRLRLLNGREIRPDAVFVMYWMRTAVRTEENPALDTAVALANELQLPTLVYHALSERYPYASDRHHTFILEGARDVQAAFAGSGVTYAFHLERAGHRGRNLLTLADQAALIVTEEMPAEPLRSWTSLLARQVDAPVLSADTACIVPMQVIGKAYDRAFAFRNATKKQYKKRLWQLPNRVEPKVVAKQIELPFAPVDLQSSDIADLVSRCEIDHAIGPVADTVGGSQAGNGRWEAFKQNSLAHYAKWRNNPLIDGVSRMSAYLHYGMVSPMRIAREAAECDNDGAQKYLDELLIWRELAYAFCFYRKDHWRLSSLPAWAIETLQQHQQDERPVLHSWETLARAQTGDTLWDAAQRSLLLHGELHNNVRMTWGKAILNWTPDAKSALAMIIDLNHRYALDGRDPASFGGILWCLGQFDRPFPPARPIVGTVRDRSTSQHGERLDVDAFFKKTTKATRTPMPSVAVVGAGISGLMCARTLADHGFDVTVFEKSRGVGGRMATRRTDTAMQFDHGAQYFTARDSRFQRYVQSWLADGIVKAWSGEIVVLKNGVITGRKSGTDRFVATPGMNAVCKHLARDLKIRLQSTATAISRHADRWRITGSDEHSLGEFDVAIVSAPAPQSAELLSATRLAAKAKSVKMEGSWALMLAFEQPLQHDFDGAFVHNSPISWIARNSSKPDRDANHDLWVVHAASTWSEAHLEDNAESVAEELLAAFWRATALPSRAAIHQKAHRWRYAIPPSPLADKCMFDPELDIGACGDWCAGPRVEGAFLSGAALAGRVLATLKRHPPGLGA